METNKIYIIIIILMILDELLTYIGIFYKDLGELNILYPYTCILKIITISMLGYLIYNNSVDKKILKIGLNILAIYYLLVVINNSYLILL